MNSWHKWKWTRRSDRIQLEIHNAIRIPVDGRQMHAAVGRSHACGRGLFLLDEIRTTVVVKGLSQGTAKSEMGTRFRTHRCTCKPPRPNACGAALTTEGLKELRRPVQLESDERRLDGRRRPEGDP